MPSQEHEALADLIRDRPDVVVALLRGAGVVLAEGVAARRLDPTFAGYAPDYTADAAVAIGGGGALPGLVVVVEVQLARDEDKRYSWPVYEALARARHRAKACVLVVALDPVVARWAREPFEIGPGGSRFAPVVIGPAEVPVITDEAEAMAMPELAVLSAVAHGNRREGGLEAVVAAIGAITAGPEDRAKLYLDLILAALNEATRTATEALMLTKYEYRSDFARRYVAEGKAEGKAEGLLEGEAIGMAEALLQLAAVRGLAVSDAQRGAVLACRDVARLRRWLERVATAKEMSEALAD